MFQTTNQYILPIPTFLLVKSPFLVGQVLPAHGVSPWYAQEHVVSISTGDLQDVPGIASVIDTIAAICTYDPNNPTLWIQTLSEKVQDTP